jgi:peptide/nickel transport system substrate-binding protein
MKPQLRSLLIAAMLGALSAMPAAAQAQELRAALATFVPALDPAEHSGNDATQMMHLIYDTLIERVPDAVPLQYRPGLATAWTKIDPTTWEVKLRENVKFQDGNTMSADDVAFSLNRIFRKEDPAYMTVWGRYFANFKDVEVVDPLTVRIHTIREEPLFEALMSTDNAAIVSSKEFATLGREGARLQPVGTGPYKVTEFVPREKAVLERFDDFWGEPAPLAKLDLTFVSEVASRITGLVNNEFDLITNIPPDQASALEVDGVHSLGVSFPIFHVWVLNMSNGPTSNKLIRQAMNLCTDTEALNQGLWGGLGKAPRAHQFSEYGEPLYMPDLNLIEYNPEKAKALLAEAGYKGEPIVAQFTQSYYLYGDLAAQAIQQQWTTCGLNLQLQQVEQTDPEKAQIVSWSNPLFYPDPMGTLDGSWSPSSVYAQNGLWAPQAPDWTETYDKVRYGTDPEQRRVALRHLLELVNDEAGWIILYQPYELYGMRNNLDFKVPTALRAYTLPFRAGEFTFTPN